MNVLNLIGWSSSPQTPSCELPDIYGFPCDKNLFTEIDVITIYQRILTDVLERTYGIPEEKQKLLWDNCLASENSEGVVTIISKAMYNMNELFLVYRKDLDVVRKATTEEERQIRDDYKKANRSNVGVYASFKNFKKCEMIKVYSVLEYLSICSLYKSANLSTAIQIKLEDLRKSVGAFDSDAIYKQAKDLAEALKKGKSVAIDAKDSIGTTAPDLTAVKESLAFTAQKQSLYLGLPASWVTGLVQKGLSDTGEGDSRAVERGLKPYFFSIIKPICESLFEGKLTFKTDNYYGIQTATQTLTTFEATSEQFVSKDNKTEILNNLFGLPVGSKGDEVEPEITPTTNNQGNTNE